MEDHVFKMIMQRFDTIELLHREHLERMEKHVESDNEIHAVVERHSTYWKLLSLGIPVVGAALAKKMGW